MIGFVQWEGAKMDKIANFQAPQQQLNSRLNTFQEKDFLAKMGQNEKADRSDLSKRRSGGTGNKYDAENGQGIYVLRDPVSGEIRYVGRGDVYVRGVSHAKTLGKSHLVMEIVHNNNLTKAEAIHLEQRLLNYFGGAKSQNPNTSLINEIRSYSSNNPNAKIYDVAGVNRAHADAIWKQTMIKLGL
jgi:hypothetical protein